MNTESVTHPAKKIDEIIKLLLNKLKDGRAYTEIEVSNTIHISRNKLKAILPSLVSEGIIQNRGNRKRQYYFIEDKTLLAKLNKGSQMENQHLPKGIKYSRHCYKHLAGYAGVKITEALIAKAYLKPDENHYTVTEAGRKWFAAMGVPPTVFHFEGKKLSKACLDFSERKSHLAGKLGNGLLSRLLDLKWMELVPGSREIKISPLGKKRIQDELQISL